MKDSDCVRFLQAILPRLRMRWPGFRRVRGQVCKRVGRRIGELGLASVGEYAAYLEDNPGEWARLDVMCRVTVSKFWRDRAVFDRLRNDVLPGLLKDGGIVRCWSAGCASGEEAYSLALAWELHLRSRFPDARLEIVATDADAFLLDRAHEASYSSSSLRDLPAEWRDAAFESRGDRWILRPEVREHVEFRNQDVRLEYPEETFHLVLCRNLVFTYFDESFQKEIARKLTDRLHEGGTLVVGIHETIPETELLRDAGPGFYLRRPPPPR